MSEVRDDSGAVHGRRSSQDPGRTRDGVPRRAISRRLAYAFGVVAAISIAMCLIECFLVFHASSLISRMQEMEAGSASSSRLAVAVRDQYLHEVHWIIDRDDVHLGHAREAEARVHKEIAMLEEGTGTGELEHLKLLEKRARELARLFAAEVVPAVKSGEMALVKRHHDEMNSLSQGIGADADRIASFKAQHMAEMHDRAIQATRRGAWVAVVCIASVLLVSCYFVLGLQRAIAQPVEELARTASAFARGDFHVRVAQHSDDELGELARAFNRMVQELSLREQRLIQSERMAAIGQLAAGLAHEINNPIGIIRGYLRTMSPRSPPEQLLDELRILDEEAAACQRLVNDLLGFSRISALRLADTDMERLLTQAVERFHEAPAARGRTVSVNVRPGAIQADEGRIRQVVLNLLNNAAQASPHGATIEIAGSSDSEGCYAFSVADRGPGIPPESRERIFDPFFSAGTGGSGLGLTVCREIVRAHGGTISIRSREGGGAIVEVVLPGARTDTETQHE